MCVRGVWIFVFHTFRQRAVVNSWPDEIKGDAGWTWTRDLHFADTSPDWSCKYTPSMCDDGCLVTALQNFTQQVNDPNTVREWRDYSLRFVTHFVGDIHQPLHCGFASNLGGNTLEGNFLDFQNWNLHSVWDSALIYAIEDNEYDGSKDKLADAVYNAAAKSYTPASSKSLDPDAFEKVLIDWVDASAGLACKYAYVDQNGNDIEDGFDLGTGYYEFTKDVMFNQLVLASQRLAGLVEMYLVAP